MGIQFSLKMAMKTCVITFPDDWIAYSPSVLNLCAVLSAAGVNPKVIAFCGKVSTGGVESQVDVTYLKIPSFLLLIFSKLRILSLVKAFIIAWNVRRQGPFSHYIGCDAVGALGLQLAGVAAYDYLSLEIRSGLLFSLINKRKIDSVIIQTMERFELQFGAIKKRIYIIQNSPILKPLHNSKKVCNRSAIRLLFFGNAIPAHGILSCLSVIEQDRSLFLEVRGIVPFETKAAIQASSAFDRVSIVDEYLDQSKVVDYVRGFDIGFCLYDFSVLDDNYLTCPSGKMFNYFAAGVPVVGTNIPGLRIIEDEGAGINVEFNGQEEILSAIYLILENYDVYSRNASRASSMYEFSNMAAPYVHMVKSKLAGFRGGL